PALNQSVYYQKTLWIKNNRSLNLALIITSFTVSLILGFRLSFPSISLIIIFGTLALLYSLLPKLTQNKKTFRLKDSIFLKPLGLISVWSFLTLYLPMIENGWFEPIDFLMLSALWFLLIFSNSVLFDIRDIKIDLLTKSTTIANQIGKQKAHRLIVGILFLQCVLILAFWSLSGNSDAAFILLLTSLIFFQLNRHYEHNKTVSPPFFILADMTLILPGLMLAGLSLG
ncbi:MAG: hypothetical protein OEY59_07875, partial [Deltaproteobacteria bacterium]|nr:hypothetical protein [Deltaproteobacteria bacterium]